MKENPFYWHDRSDPGKHSLSQLLSERESPLGYWIFLVGHWIFKFIWSYEAQ
jgi:hypothetical protein